MNISMALNSGFNLQRKHETVRKWFNGMVIPADIYALTGGPNAVPDFNAILRPGRTNYPAITGGLWATTVAEGFKAWLSAIPDTLYTLFGVGYVGYSTARTFDKRVTK